VTNTIQHHNFRGELCPLLDTESAARLLGVSKSFLDKKRVRGGGPRFCKLGQRVRYRAADISAWLEAGQRESTSETAR
jgi:excisionase family DNA binding protein